jgi:hypothetical protein
MRSRRRASSSSIAFALLAGSIGLLALAACAEGAGDGEPTTTSGPGPGGGGGEGGGTGGEGAAAPFCEPASTQDCYEGDAATLGVGVCVAGIQTCDADGSAWGAGTGQVRPGTEDCATMGDEDCDGSACSDVLWSLVTGDGFDDKLVAAEFDSSGNLVLAGNFDGSISFGGAGDTLVSGGVTDFFIAKLDPDGNHLWSKSFGGVDYQFVNAIALDSQDNILLTGAFNSNLDLGGGAMTAIGVIDAYVAKLDKNGVHVWSQLVTEHASGMGGVDPVGIKGPRDVAVNASGDVIVVGGYSGHFGGSCTPSCPTSANGTGGFMRRYQGFLGSLIGSTLYDGPGAQIVDRVEADSNNALIISGRFNTEMTIGGVVLSAAGTDQVGMLAKLNPTLTTAWAKKLGVVGKHWIDAVKFAANGDVLIAGEFQGPMDLGMAFTSNGANDVFAARFDGAGTLLWGQSFGDSDDDILGGAGFDGNDALVLCGTFLGTLDFGGGDLTAGGAGKSAFLSKLDGSGAHVWSKAFGSSGDTWPTACAIDAAGRALMVGYLDGELDFGDGPHSAAGANDVFVAVFQP